MPKQGDTRRKVGKVIQRVMLAVVIAGVSVAGLGFAAAISGEFDLFLKVVGYAG